MSTKIYNGFKFISGNFKKINKELAQLKEEIKPMADLELATYLYNEAITKFDIATLYDKEKENFIEIVSSKMMESFESKKEFERCPFDVDFSIVVFPLGNIFYGMFFTENKTLKKHFLNKLDVVSDFSYWDNTDRPKEIPNYEWRKRKNVWNKIFEKSWVPSEVGLGFECCKTNVYKDFEYLFPLVKVKSFKNRVNRLALDKSVHEIYKIESQDKQVSSGDLSLFSEIFFNVSTYLQNGDSENSELSNEYKKIVQGNIKLCNEKLVRKIKPDLLFNRTEKKNNMRKI